MRGGAAVVALVAALSACGSSKSAECVVKVSFRADATPTQIGAAQRSLKANDRVAAVIFVSSAEGLRIMEKKYPELVENLTYNPIPDTLEVTVRERDVPRLIEDLKPPPAGVASVHGCPASRRVIVPFP